MGATGIFLSRYNAALLALLFLSKNLEKPVAVLIKGYFAIYLLIRVSRVRVSGGSPFFYLLNAVSMRVQRFCVFKGDNQSACTGDNVGAVVSKNQN